MLPFLKYRVKSFLRPIRLLLPSKTFDLHEKYAAYE